jgi:hypothetical protein
MTRDSIIRQILDSSKIPHKDGYVADISDNLIPTILLEDFRADLDSGDGNELDSKFKALYSSSALGVNCFGFIKRYRDKFSFLGEDAFTCGQFEKKLPTGLKGKSPNLDFYLENKNCIIGFESKFLETLSPKRPSFSYSYSDSFLASLDNGLPAIVKYYRTNDSEQHLDTAQLIKHSIGLLNNKGKKHAKLIYIFWEPTDTNKYSEYKKHRDELDKFSTQMKNIEGLAFHYLTYKEFCDSLSENTFFRKHIDSFKEKYQLT